MVRLYEVIFHTSIEPLHLGGYEGYFKAISSVRIGRGYNVKLLGYGGWEDKKMNIARFCHIRSDFHPEAGEYAVGRKCHQLRYLLRSVNDTASKNFDLGTTAAFYEGGISTCSRFYCVRQYNTDKLEKIRIDFFVMANITHYFVRHKHQYV